jgi:tRNA-uridine 2-sulfurtransferase
MPSRIVVAMSGGVDSSVAAARLVDEGHEVVGITLHLWDDPDPAAQSRCCAPEDIRDARRVADQLGFPHYSLDRKDVFAREIVEPFVDAYLSGRTPSPCATCNQVIKIPALLRAARLMGAEAIATGHYARVVQHAQGLRIARGVDRTKDQSYFLCALDQGTLSKLRLPLGDETKERVRREALARGLVGAHKGESQDLCFVQDGGYVRFVEDRGRARLRPGRILDADGRELGAHEGIHRFTLGQRKGLGVAAGRPVFVSRIDADSGDVVVDDEAAILVHRIVVADPVVAVGVSLPVQALVQVRYRHAGAPATLSRAEDGALVVSFERPVRAASPGQFAVAYMDDEVVAGGIISSVGGGPIALDPGSVSK